VISRRLIQLDHKVATPAKFDKAGFAPPAPLPLIRGREQGFNRAQISRATVAPTASRFRRLFEHVKPEERRTAKNRLRAPSI
jgi:hypothetical protein